MNYYEKKSISFSLLKEFYRSLNNAGEFWSKIGEERDIVEKEYFTIGNIVDTLLTEPDTFDSRYEITDTVPPPSLNNLLQEFINTVESGLTPMEEYLADDVLRKATIISSRERIGFQSNWKDDTVVNKFEDSCLDYLELYSSCREEGKSLITVLQNEEGRRLAEELKRGLYTSSYFSKDIEYDFGQIEIFWTIGELEFKHKLDKVIVIGNKIIPIDVKTYFLNFIDSFYSHKLYLQASMYSAPLKLLSDPQARLQFPEDPKIKVQVSDKKLGELLKNPKYKLDDNFIFLTVDKSGVNPPIPYAVSQKVLENYAFNINIVRQDTGESIELPGWLPKSEQLWYHIKNNQWKYPKDIINNGIINIKSE